MDEPQLINEKASLVGKVQQRMNSLVKNSKFVTEQILKIGGSLEKATPYLNGYHNSLVENQEQIHDSIDEMIKSGKMDIIAKYMTPENKFLFVVGGNMALTILNNMNNGNSKSKVSNFLEKSKEPIRSSTLQKPQEPSRALYEI
jgi:hypothetical protein